MISFKEMDILISLIWSLYNVHVYQNITLYPTNIYNNSVLIKTRIKYMLSAHTQILTALVSVERYR
jgi:hypothetical protein